MLGEQVDLFKEAVSAKDEVVVQLTNKVSNIRTYLEMLSPYIPGKHPLKCPENIPQLEMCSFFCPVTPTYLSNTSLSA